MKKGSSGTLTLTSLGLGVCDVLAVIFSAAMAHFMLVTFPPDQEERVWDALSTGAVLLACMVTPTIFSTFGLYVAWRGRAVFAELRRVLAAWVAVFMVLASIALATKTGAEFSRLWMGTWFLYGAASLFIGRIILRRILNSLRRRGVNTKRIILVVSGPVGGRVIRQLQANTWLGLTIQGVFVDQSDEQMSRRLALLTPRPNVLGSLDNVADYVLEHPELDQIWFAMPLSHEEKIEEVLFEIRHSTLDVCLVPDIFGFELLNHSFVEVAGLPVVNLRATPMAGPNLLVKMLEDYILGTLILILVLPLMLVIAAAIKLTSPGPVFFVQQRHGWDGRPINIYKFRSMRSHQEGNGTLTQARRGDDRITKVGAFLRRTSLDELPQFINVLQGRMSIVGPRPHALEHNEIYKGNVDRYMLRHKVKPGITGWAQVNGLRGETETVEKMRARVHYDLHYIENWSLSLDIRIIFLTLFRGFTGQNAY